MSERHYDHDDYEELTRYRCRWCGKDTLKTPYLHRCKFNPKKKNCFSCRHCQEIRFYSPDDHRELTARQARDLYTEKALCCGKGKTISIGDLAKEKWDMNCPDYEIMPSYEGKKTYLQNIRPGKVPPSETCLDFPIRDWYADDDDDLPF